MQYHCSAAVPHRLTAGRDDHNSIFFILHGCCRRRMEPEKKKKTTAIIWKFRDHDHNRELLSHFSKHCCRIENFQALFSSAHHGVLLDLERLFFSVEKCSHSCVEGFSGIVQHPKRLCCRNTQIVRAANCLQAQESRFRGGLRCYGMDNTSFTCGGRDRCERQSRQKWKAMVASPAFVLCRTVSGQMETSPRQRPRNERRSLPCFLYTVFPSEFRRYHRYIQRWDICSCCESSSCITLELGKRILGPRRRGG